MPLSIFLPAVLLFIFLALIPQIASLGVAQTRCKRVTKNPVPPAPARCNVGGKLSSPNLLATLQAFVPAPAVADQIPDCRDVCLDRGAACQSFSHDPATRTCKLFGKTISDQGYTTSATSAKFWDATCYDTTCFTIRKFFVTAGTTTYDDATFRVTPGFPMKFFGVTYGYVDMCTNGWLSFGGAGGETGYNNEGLTWPPYATASKPSNAIVPDFTIFGLWDDILVQAVTFPDSSPDHGLSWWLDELGPARRLIFNWRGRLNAVADSFVDMDISFVNTQPGVINVTYNTLINTRGQTATVGVQTSAQVGQNILFSQQAADLHPCQTILFDTNMGTVTSSVCA